MVGLFLFARCFLARTDVYLEKHFPLFNSRVVFNEVVQTSKYYMRDVTAVESSWLVELAPHFYKQAKVGQRKESATPACYYTAMTIDRVLKSCIHYFLISSFIIVPKVFYCQVHFFFALGTIYCLLCYSAVGTASVQRYDMFVV